MFLVGYWLSFKAEHIRITENEQLMNITNNFSEKFAFSGTVTKELYQTDFQKVFQVKIDNFDTTSTRYFFDKDNKTSVLINIPKNLDLIIGEGVEGKIKFTPLISYPIEWFIRYVWFHHAYAKWTLYTFKKVQKLSKSLFEDIKEKTKQIIFDWFPKKVAALILGITIGNTDLLTGDIKQDFKNSGLTHILVVSGSNIAFVILFLEFFLKYLPISRIIKYIIVLIFLGAYGTITGWEIPVIRATIMGLISYFSIRQSYKVNSVALLFGLAVIFCIVEPLYLLYDSSFGLSFGATLGIVVFQKPIADFFEKKLKFSFFNTIMSVTLAATLGSLPAVIYFFETIGIFGIIANILVAFFMGILLFLSVLYIVLSFLVSESIIYILWYIIYLFGQTILNIGSFFGKIEPINIPQSIKIPLCITLCFIGFLYIIDTEERKILNSK